MIRIEGRGKTGFCSDVQEKVPPSPSASEARVWRYGFIEMS